MDQFDRDHLYNSPLQFDPSNQEHLDIQETLIITLHRCPGKVLQRDFCLDLSDGLSVDTLLPFPLPPGKGMSCFNQHNNALNGFCHVVQASSLASCSFELKPTQIFVRKNDHTVKVVHCVVRPTIPMTVEKFEYHWNYPRRPILAKEVAVAEKCISEPDPHPRRQRELERAVESLKVYDQLPQPNHLLGTENDQLHWELCQIAGAAEPVELKHRLFNDPNLQMISLALRTFVHSASADDNDRLLAYLLHYSFGATDTAISYSKPNVLAAPSRNLIYRSLENLLVDTDEFDKYELDELDEQCLRWLMVMFQPIAICDWVAEGHSIIDNNTTSNGDLRAQAGVQISRTDF